MALASTNLSAFLIHTFIGMPNQESKCQWAVLAHYSIAKHCDMRHKRGFMNYSDYFEIQHHSGEVSMDKFIAEAMRTDIHMENDQETIDYLNTSRTTLKNEVLTCYQFLKEQGLLKLPAFLCH